LGKKAVWVDLDLFGGIWWYHQNQGKSKNLAILCALCWDGELSDPFKGLLVTSNDRGSQRSRLESPGTLGLFDSNDLEAGIGSYIPISSMGRTVYLPSTENHKNQVY